MSMRNQISGGPLQNPQHGSIFELEFPQSVGIYATYGEAQKAVDYLSDEKFEVRNLCIVGTDLKSVERVLGRKTWGTVVQQSLVSGVSTGLLFAVLMILFVPLKSFLLLIVAALALGIVLSLIFNAIGYSVSGGRRDFTSVTQTVATKYEILCEHKVAQQARDTLTKLPGARAKQFE